MIASIAGILSIIEKKRVKGLDWEEQNLDQVVAYLRTITGLNFYVSATVRADKFEDTLITAQLDDVSIKNILDDVVTAVRQDDLVAAPRKPGSPPAKCPLAKV